MISRRSALALAEAYAKTFTRGTRSSWGFTYAVKTDLLYDFLFENSYEGWFCNLVQGSTSGHSDESSSSASRALKEFIMRLHTGESLAGSTSSWTWPDREKLGQSYLTNLAQDILAIQGLPESETAKLRSSLELDGYSFREGSLLASEEDALDTKESTGAIESLFKELALGDGEVAFHHLRLSEEHYLGERWDDSIGNSRKFLEAILLATAQAHSVRETGRSLPDEEAERPVRIRTYLETAGLLEQKEVKALAAVYSLLSETGNHPYMAKNDQARLLRHLALTFSQFVLLRLKGSLAESGN